MTTAQIEQSRYEHWQLTASLCRLVYAGTPSRIGPCFDAAGNELGLWDYGNDREYRRPRRKA